MASSTTAEHPANIATPRHSHTQTESDQATFLNESEKARVISKGGSFDVYGEDDGKADSELTVSPLSTSCQLTITRMHQSSTGPWSGGKPLLLC